MRLRVLCVRDCVMVYGVMLFVCVVCAICVYVCCVVYCVML